MSRDISQAGEPTEEPARSTRIIELKVILRVKRLAVILGECLAGEQFREGEVVGHDLTFAINLFVVLSGETVNRAYHGLGEEAFQHTLSIVRTEGSIPMRSQVAENSFAYTLLGEGHFCSTRGFGGGLPWIG